jgi:hypothetical protein
MVNRHYNFREDEKDFYIRIAGFEKPVREV